MSQDSRSTLSDHNNISNVAADASGIHSKNSTTVAFVNAASKDFHFSPADTAAKEAGVDLSADPNLPFAVDIDGQARPGGNAWDIGADEQFLGVSSTTPANGVTDVMVKSPVTINCPIETQERIRLTATRQR